MVNDVPALRADMYVLPTLVSVPPLIVRKILLLAVTAVVLTVMVPPERVAIPIVSLGPRNLETSTPDKLVIPSVDAYTDGSST
jgi:hypothetical protein